MTEEQAAISRVLDEQPVDPRVEGVGIGQVQEQEQGCRQQDQDDGREEAVTAAIHGALSDDFGKHEIVMVEGSNESSLRIGHQELADT